MHISRRSLALLAALGGLAVAAPANAADRTVTVTPGATTAVANWAGPITNGANVSFLVDGPGPTAAACGKDAQNYCDSTLVHVVADNIGDGNVKFRIDGFAAYSDFDIRVYESDETGALGSQIGGPHGDVADSSPLGDLDPRHTGAGDFETTDAPLGGYIDSEFATIDAYFVVLVPYFAVANDSYAGHATFTHSAPVPE